MSLIKPLLVKPEPNFHLFIKFNDGKEGVVDLSSLVGKGVFAAWLNSDLFNKVYIDETGAVAWNNDLDICSDALYSQLTEMKDATN